MARLTRDTVHRAFSVSIVSRMDRVFRLLSSKERRRGLFGSAADSWRGRISSVWLTLKIAWDQIWLSACSAENLTHIQCPTSTSSHNVLYHLVMEVVLVRVSYKAELLDLSLFLAITVA